MWISAELVQRMHKDGRFALVEGRPARVIGFWNTSDILRVGFRHNVMHFVTVHGLVEDEGVFALVCGQIQQLARFFHLAKRPGLLVSFLNRKTADGPWMNALKKVTSSASYPISTFANSRFETLSENGDSRSDVDIACGTRNGSRRWDVPSGAVSQPSVSATKSDSSAPEGDFAVIASESRERSSPSLARAGIPDVIAHHHGRTSPPLPLYMNCEAIASTLNRGNNVMECNAVQPTTSSRYANGYFDYVNVSNASSPTKSTGCGIRRAASDMPYYVNVNDSSCSNSFSSEILVGHFSAYGGALNQLMIRPEASPRVFNSELSIASSLINEPNVKHVESPCRDIGARAHPPCSKKSVCRAGSWPKHIYNVAERTQTVRHLSICSIGANSFMFGSERVGMRSSNAHLPNVTVGESFECERKMVNASECRGKYLRQQQRTTRNRGRDAASFKDKRGKYLRQQQRTTRNRGRDAASFKDKSRLSQHQRSRSVGLEATVKRSGSTREENWDRAKRIIGGVRKSVNGSRNVMQSASLDKLVSSPNTSSKSRLPHSGVSVEAPSPPAAEKIPRLDVSVNAETPQNNAVSSASVQRPSPIPGLVKLPPERFGLKKMGSILTKSLRKSVTGSYSKYDGERATHHYNPGDANELPLPPVVDCIESAVNKGRARLIEADRRNSSFADGLHSTNLNMSTHTPRRYTFTIQTSASLKPYAANVHAKKEPGGDSDARSYNSNVLLNLNMSTHTPRRYTFTIQTSASLKPYAANVHAKKEPGGDSDARSYNSNVLLNCSVNAPTAHVSPAVQRSIQPSNASVVGSPPPLPPKTYLKKKAAEEYRIAMVAESKETQSSSEVPRPLKGNYCAVVAANTPERGTSRKTSREDTYTVYTQIDPIATLAATQTQADMMKERERQATGGLVAQNAYASDRALGTRKKRSHGSDDRSNFNKGFFARRIWRKPSKTRSHSDLRF
ncbi:hypothetical protein Tcan_03335 [Toxocara canis]|uniref:Uncharacterized protein n=1 Tax=Toxocara canis TaxID=6265 RepID=A0A0B2VXP9_TOXCA|nr:hypothetical protein Tcan_03335 [Toxocara canis]